jgi:hypothetical protein
MLDFGVLVPNCATASNGCPIEAEPDADTSKTMHSEWDWNQNGTPTMIPYAAAVRISRFFLTLLL